MEESKNAKPKKKKKNGIMFNEKLYVPVNQKKYHVKNIFNMPDFTIQCDDYLRNKYRFLSEKLINEILAHNIFVMMPSWSNHVDSIMNDLNRTLYNTILHNISDYKECKFLREIRYPKYASLFNAIECIMLHSMSLFKDPDENPLYQNRLFQAIRYLRNSICIQPIYARSNNIEFLRDICIYMCSCAEFVFLDPYNFPLVSVIESKYPIIVEGTDNDEIVYPKQGILFKMKNIRDGKTIFITEYESLNYNEWSTFISALDSGKIGKVVGETVYILPYTKVGFIPDPIFTWDTLKKMNI